MDENNKKKKRAYLDDFHKNAKGDYEYRGIHYVWDGKKEDLKKETISLWIFGILMTICVIGAGCLPVPSMINCVYVILPFTVCFICGVSVIWGLVRLTSANGSLRAYVYDATVEQIPVRAVGTMIGAAAAFGGEIIYLFKNGFEGNRVSSLVFLLGLAGVFGFSWILRKRIQQMSWKRSI